MDIVRILTKLKEWTMGLWSHDVVRVSETDPRHHYLLRKLKPGENVSFDVENDPDSGDYIVISANKNQGRAVVTATADLVLDPTVSLVLVDASQNPVTLTLPPAHDYLGELSVVCVDPSFGINIVPNGSTTDQIFDASNMSFVHRGDAMILTSDRLMNGNWYVVGRHFSNWYA